ncbi:hypothetical protein C8F01DRAFT_1126233 [Mycena amicta]|nr:hypothetical protein C8F01DRAFT_1126233 [Mycena amicta]
MDQRDWHWGRFCGRNDFASGHPHPRRRETTGPGDSLDGNRLPHPDAAHTRMDRHPRRAVAALAHFASTRFFNRHTGIRTLKYMAGAQVHAEEEAPMLCMPNLESLNTVLGYLLYALADVSSSSDSDYRFPRLAHIELRPTPHTLLRPALSLLARQTAAPPVAALTLWSLPADELQDLDGNELWTDIILPGVRVLVLNECKVPVVDLTGLGSFPTLLARVFPALVKLELNYCALGRSASIIKRQTERDSTQAFAEEVRRVFAGERRRLGGVPDRTVNLKLVVDGREV